jgi:tetratricopeptide (TPR) repeat protein
MALAICRACPKVNLMSVFRAAALIAVFLLPAEVRCEPIDGLSFSKANMPPADECDTPVRNDLAVVACTKEINSGIWKGLNLAVKYFNRGNAYRQKGDNDRAIADYTQAIAIDPKMANSYYNRGGLYRERGDNDRAIVDYTQAIGIYPKDADFYYNRGNAYLQKGDNDRAIVDYTQTIALDPKFARAYSSRGNAHRNKGDHDLALADYTQAIGIDPKNTLAYYNRANEYLKKGDNDRALADYTLAIGIDPKFVAVYYNRGNAYRQKGHNDRAIADFTQAIDINPKSAFAYRGRGLSYLYSGSPDKALADLAQANALMPKDAYTAVWLDIVSQRNSLPSRRLTQTSSQIDMTVWPAPIIRLFMGQATLAAVQTSADDPDAAKKKGQICELNFYAGELSLLKKANDEAISFFRLASSACPHSFIEWGAANAELKALGIVP